MIEYLLSQETQEYIKDHLNDDPAELMLRSPLRSSEHFHLVLDQIKSKRKAKLKLPTWFEQKGIVFPPPLSMEQCSSEETAKFKADLMSGRSFVDLTGGFGVDTFYLSSNFEQATYIEKQPNLVELAKHNFDALSAKISCIHTTAEDYLTSIDKVDWIYLDPARRDDNANKVFRLSDCTPDVETLQYELLKKSSNVLIKLAPLLDIKQTLRDLSNVANVYVLAFKNEVKELLVHLKADYGEGVCVHCVNLKQNDKEVFDFSFDEEEGEVELSALDTYLYEPNAAILKGGAFKSVARRFKLKKLHPNTHLYTSKELITDFPGRAFSLTKELPLNKKLKSQFPEMKANISTRNFPLSVKQIRAKTKIQEGGQAYIFAFTDIDKKRFVLCQKEY